MINGDKKMASYAPTFRKEENKFIITYLREHGGVFSDDLPLENFSLRQKMQLLLSLYQREFLTRRKIKRRWFYELSSVYKNKKMWWEHE